jgi:hypothetical protein
MFGKNIINTKEKLVQTVRDDIEEAKSVSLDLPVFKDLQIILDKLADLELPELEGERSYWLRWEDGGYMIYTHIEFWDEEADCWNSKEMEDVMKIMLS